MLELVPGAQLAEIEDAGHDLHLDQPERWRQAVGDYLATLDR
jgi:pimeloyl-ACP methyl ester carboxylesterase